jgi:uncharacterized protein YcbX
MSAHVSGLAVTAIKGARIHAVPQIELGEMGARGNRAFYLIDDRNRMRNGKQLGELQGVSTDYDPDSGRLVLSFPDGSRAEGKVTYGPALSTGFFSRTYPARTVLGPWSDAVSDYLGQPLRLVAPEISAIDRGPEGAVSLISRASLTRLAEVAAQDTVDARRFRMLIELDGVSAHEEDAWMGRSVRVGKALVAVRGNIGRCLVTSRDPESGVIDLPTLDLLGSYRRDVTSTEPLPFGVHAAVLEPGTVSVGDPVTIGD